MRFVMANDLKKGMRLARPIYNKSGVLLYDRDTKLTKQGINSIINFKLLGIYILEPAEPLPPMTEDDREFERFQTMSVFAIKEDMELLLAGKRPINLDRLAPLIQKDYSKREKKLCIQQDIRSEEDYVYKHALNSAIIASLIAGKIGLDVEKQIALIKACALYDIGKMLPDISRSDFETQEEYEIQAQLKGGRFLADNDYIPEAVQMMVIDRYRFEVGNKTINDCPLTVKIMKVAQDYDDMTSMKPEGEISSNVSAVRTLLAHSELYDAKAVSALVACINILYPGICVELTNKVTGLVIKANPSNVLRPIVLCFPTNEVLDLSNNRVFDDVQIADIMKTMDQRIHIDPELVNQFIKEYNN